MVNIFSFENIAQQDGMFFKELSEGLNTLRQEIKEKKIGHSKDKNKYLSSIGIELIRDIIEKYTNLKISFKESSIGFAINNPIINSEHIFNEFSFLDSTNINDDDLKTSFYTKSKKLKRHFDYFKVDISNGKISSNINELIGKDGIVLFLDFGIINNSKYTNDEIAAVILHEIGHITTSFIYMARIFTTNEALNLLHYSLSDINRDKEKTYLLSIFNEVDMLKDIDKYLKNNNLSKEECDIIILSKLLKITPHIANTKYNNYNSINCEYMADNYVARNKGSLALVTALDKIMRENKSITKIVSVLIYTFSVIVFPLLPLLAVVLYTDTVSRKIYDNPFIRFSRIKHNNIQLLKNKNISSIDIEKLLEENKYIDDIINKYNDNKTFCELVIYWCNKSFRNEYDFKKLQSQLEDLANNKLFENAAKLAIK